jgi:hypothetical protein
MTKELIFSFSGNKELTIKYQYISCNLLDFIRLKIKKSIYHKINFIFNEDNNFEIVGLEDKICNININLNFSEINENLIIDTVINSLKKICLNKDLQSDFLEEIKKNIKTHSLIHDIVFLKKNKDKKSGLQGEVLCRYYSEYVEFIIQINGKNFTTCRFSFFKSKNLPILLTQRFNNTLWQEDNFVVKDQYDEIHNVFNVENQNLTIEYYPKIHPYVSLVNLDKLLHYETSQSDTLIFLQKYVQF